MSMCLAMLPACIRGVIVSMMVMCVLEIIHKVMDHVM